MSLPTKFTTRIDAALSSERIVDAEFIKLTVPNSIDAGGPDYYFSSSFKNEVDPVTGRAWTALGGFISISGHQRDLSVTSYDTVVTLVGLDPAKIGKVLEIGSNDNSTVHAGLKGSQIQIYRGFYDSATYTLIDQIQLRYTGIVTSYTITEDRVEMIDTFTLALHASSFKTVLENRTAGRTTNSASWKKVAPTDTSMDRVASISNVKWPFGVKLA